MNLDRLPLRRPVSLRLRLTLGGFALLAVLVALLNVFVYINLRDQMLANLDDILASRAQLAGEIARQVPPEMLEARFVSLGLRAEVHGPQQQVLVSDPMFERFEDLPPGRGPVRAADLVSRHVDFPDGYRITVYASRAGVDATLRRVLILQLVGSAGLLLAAGLLLYAMSRLALRPLQEVVGTARRIASGGSAQERLEVVTADPELAEMAATFNGMLDALEAAVDDARRSETRSRRFLADAAHQLRTPITAMRSTVDALIREREPAERERLIDNLLRETSRTSRLLASLLLIAELDRGEEPERVPIAIGQLLRDEAERAASLAPHLDVRIRADDLVVLEADEFGLREAIANLLDNARRHAATSITVALEQADGRARLTVADDGAGVPEGDEERIFERFVTAGGRGSGLGLPIVRAVARAHGGDAYHREGRFVIDLPVAELEMTVEVPTRAFTP